MLCIWMFSWKLHLCSSPLYMKRCWYNVNYLNRLSSLRTVSLHAFRTIMPLCHFLKQLYFQTNGKQSATFFGLWASNEANYGASHTMWRCPLLGPSWFSTTILETITALPPQTVWCVYTDWWVFFFVSFNKKKQKPLWILLCSANN